MQAAKADLDFTRIDPAAWAKLPENSLDFAVLEQAANISLVRFDGAWSDLGGWQSVWQESPQDADGNASFGHVTALDCENSLLRAESDDIELVGIGLKNIVAVAMRDAVIVADMSVSQNVKQAVTLLKAQAAKQGGAISERSRTLGLVMRPWCWRSAFRSSASMCI